MNKWSKYGCPTGDDTFSTNIYALHEGELSPWEATFDAHLIKGSIRHYCRGEHLYYSPYSQLLTLACSAKGWACVVAEGRAHSYEQAHQLELVRLKPLAGDKIIHKNGAPKYMPYQYQGSTAEYWIIPFFDTKGGTYSTMCCHPDNCYAKDSVYIGRPPRVIIRKMKEGKFIVDIDTGRVTLYYGKYASYERAMANAQMLFTACMLAPEDVPEELSTALSREYFGRVFRERLSKPEQLRLADYDCALEIISGGWAVSRRNGSAEFAKRFWENPKEAVRQFVNSRDVWLCCYEAGEDSFTHRSGMKRLIPYLTGKYTKTLAPLFRNALALTDEEIKAEIDPRKHHLREWVDYLI